MKQPSPRRVFSGSPWEQKVGYCRAVRVGQTIHVAGTTATDPNGTVLAVGDPYGQAKAIFAIIEKALVAVGATLNDVVRTRMFVTRIDDWQEIGRAHQEVFGAIYPAATMVAVSRLIDPEHLVEIEVDAVVAAVTSEA
ncbi:RidA family protein [Acanthopleuribacter pedis]|uniref:RidA family protein n=1 Tax=Acanthopleuribacter pedis TaxID=442870 RepID=A0A8J7Q4W7_9BACT|nr:RidA family protein [Acanthopleuribacter pedis]MBO1318162.1 RidA family protein [Acanthopleuribacter pedis]